MKKTTQDNTLHRSQGWAEYGRLGLLIIPGLFSLAGLILGIMVGKLHRKSEKLEQEVPPSHSAPPGSEKAQDTGVNIPESGTIVQDMYLEITNIAQGANIGFLVGVVAVQNFMEVSLQTYLSMPLFAFTDLIITVIFWTRYYFDTQILRRSYRVISTIWFFIYLTTQGIGIIFVSIPYIWLAATGVFLLFAAGFYALNLIELSRKNKRGALPLMPRYQRWQARRLVDLLVVGLLSIVASFLIRDNPVLALPASLFAFTVAVWQVILNAAYRNQGFIYSG